MFFLQLMREIFFSFADQCAKAPRQEENDPLDERLTTCVDTKIGRHSFARRLCLPRTVCRLIFGIVFLCLSADQRSDLPRRTFVQQTIISDVSSAERNRER